MTRHTGARTLGSGAIAFVTLAFGAIGGHLSRQSLSRNYNKLSDLDDRLLNDIGLSRIDIERMRRHW